MMRKLAVLELKLISLVTLIFFAMASLHRCYLQELVDSLNFGEVDSIGVEVGFL